MTPCKHAAELISLSLDTPLNWRQRLALWLHLLGCDLCRRFRRQSRLIQRAGSQAGEEDNLPGQQGDTLSPEARERIKRALRGQAGGSQS
jgi:hypothetical protein